MKALILVLALAGVAFALDVGVDTILAPSGTIDSGQSIIPRMVISNMSNEPADSVSAYSTIDDGTPGGYSDSITGLYIDPLTTETLAFNGWAPRGRDSMTATAWVHCTGDTFPQNDTFRQRFFVRVKDIAVTQIITPPPDTVYDSGEVFFPQCRVWNIGNVPFTVDVRFRIGAYQSIRCGPIIFPGHARVVTAPAPYTTIPGIWACQVFAVVTGDLHPDNNIMIDTFTVRGNLVVDVDARAVLEPGSVIDTTRPFHPTGRVGNLGASAASFKSFFIIQNSSGAVVYQDSANHMLGPGDSTDVTYQDAWIYVLGNYTAVESVFMADDQNSTNDVKRIHFRVVPSQAVEESPKPLASSPRPAATVVRRLPAGAVMFDAMGRRVTCARPGVYFVVSEPPAASRQPSAVTVRKVVLQR
jgi:hypothetical protein